MINNYEKYIKEQLEESSKVKLKTITSCTASILQAEESLVHCFNNNGKVLLCGNGGSAADAQHIAAELIVRLSPDIKRQGLPAIALTTDTSVLTANSNDFGFDNIFARQIEALGQPNDLLIIFSTSGNSPNIIEAIETAKKTGIKTIGFLGGGGGKCTKLVDINIIVPSSNTQRIQETHITIGHILFGLVEYEIYNKTD